MSLASWREAQRLRTKLETLKDVCLPGFWSRYVCPALRNNELHPVETNDHYLEFHAALKKLRGLREILKPDPLPEPNRIIELRGLKLINEIAKCFRGAVRVESTVLDNSIVFRLHKYPRVSRSFAVPWTWPGPTAFLVEDGRPFGLVREIVSIPLTNQYGQILRVKVWTLGLHEDIRFAVRVNDRIYAVLKNSFSDAALLLQEIFVNQFSKAVGLP